MKRIVKQLAVFALTAVLAAGILAWAAMSQAAGGEDLALNKPVKCSPGAERFPGCAYTGTSDPAYAVNGTKGDAGQVWSTWPEDANDPGPGDRWIVVDLGEEYDLTGYKVWHTGQFTGASGNTRDFRVQAQKDPAYDFEGDPGGGVWATIDTVAGNAANLTEKDISGAAASERVRYVRLSITKCWSGDLATTNTGAVRIQEFEVYGVPREAANIALGKAVKASAGTAA